MLQIAIRAVCSGCNWTGWIPATLQTGMICADQGGTHSLWRNGQCEVGEVHTNLGSTALTRHDGLAVVCLDTGQYTTVTCPHCGLCLCEPCYVPEASPTVFDALPDSIPCAPQAPPEPEPESEPNRVAAFFYDVWCPHCTHVDTIAMLRPDHGAYEAKCPKCSRFHQVYLNGGRQKVSGR